MDMFVSMLEWLGSLVNALDKPVALVANILAGSASAIAIWVFITKRSEIKSVIDALIGYSQHVTLSELREKLDSLNRINCDTEPGRKEVVYILSEIEGQLTGSKRFGENFARVTQKVSKVIRDEKLLTEARKRSLVNELRERIRNFDIEHFSGSHGDKEL